MSDSYLAQVLEGNALWSDIDDYVEEWHASSSDEALHEFLGLTWEEYALWVEQPRALRIIIAARERDRPVSDLLEKVDEFAFAARGLSPEDARAVRAWLQETGRIQSG